MGSSTCWHSIMKLTTLMIALSTVIASISPTLFSHFLSVSRLQARSLTQAIDRYPSREEEGASKCEDVREDLQRRRKLPAKSDCAWISESSEECVYMRSPQPSPACPASVFQDELLNKSDERAGITFNKFASHPPPGGGRASLFPE